MVILSSTPSLLRSSLALLFLSLTMLCRAQQNITGRWVTVDDATGKPRSKVEITERNGKVYGSIIYLYREPGEEADPICDECDPLDDRFNKKVKGMEIIRDMRPSGAEWTGGTILDPESGKVYTCKLWLENDKLMVRGYLLFFFRTQGWLREKKGPRDLP
jgi:uncharacterized protein (DUF2147 family)